MGDMSHGHTSHKMEILVANICIGLATLIITVISVYFMVKKGLPVSMIVGMVVGMIIGMIPGMYVGMMMMEDVGMLIGMVVGMVVGMLLGMAVGMGVVSLGLFCYGQLPEDVYHKV
eukprot:TRINITY_DN16710_c0_g1_i1.p1 TRINITY_DN16710_c0_g1~~TRINITY_DN16710_c0_g1_i1.p1  ORF type:complete len:116 (-),score=12.19 TRINITY_DN16710_c0_g1_i1:101-448(-)